MKYIMQYIYYLYIYIQLYHIHIYIYIYINIHKKFLELWLSAPCRLASVLGRRFWIRSWMACRSNPMAAWWSSIWTQVSGICSMLLWPSDPLRTSASSMLQSWMMSLLNGSQRPRLAIAERFVWCWWCSMVFSLGSDSDESSCRL